MIFVRHNFVHVRFYDLMKFQRTVTRRISINFIERQIARIVENLLIHKTYLASYKRIVLKDLIERGSPDDDHRHRSTC